MLNILNNDEVISLSPTSYAVGCFRLGLNRVSITSSLLLFFFFFLSITPSFSQFKKTPKSIFQALQQGSMTGIIIETDLDSLIKYRNRNTYQPAVFSYRTERGKILRYDIRLKPRGKFRRRICDFPMIKIDFSKKDLKQRKHKKFDDYKLVTHCMNTMDDSYESVAREYLAYKLYNILSPDSYKVQFLLITYIDSKEVIPAFQHFGFIIEDTAELADRIQGTFRKKVDGLVIDSMNAVQYDFIALYQYMIGNTDWKATPIPRNVKVFKKEAEADYKMVPFDFDFSGLVAAPYAVPNSGLGQMNIRHRIFQGIENIESIDEATRLLFLAKKKKIIKHVKKFMLLSRASKKDIRGFLELFFEELESITFESSEDKGAGTK